MNGEPAIEIAKSAQRRTRRELELLAAAAASPRRAVPILDELGISAATFASDDTRAICLAIETDALKVGRPDRLALALLCRRALQAVGCWDPRDSRSFVGASRWGPGPLAALLCRAAFDPSRLRLAAAALFDAIEICAALERQEGASTCT